MADLKHTISGIEVTVPDDVSEHYLASGFEAVKADAVKAKSTTKASTSK